MFYDVSNLTKLHKNVIQTCVTKKGDRLYFPKTIPRERQSIIMTFILILLVIFAGHLYISEDRGVLLSDYAVCILFYLGICLMYRLILFLHELKHRCSRYENNLHKLFKAAFHLKYRVWIVIVICIFYLVYYFTRYGFMPPQDKQWCLFIPFLFVLHRLMDLDDFPINDSLCIAKDNGLDYGSGMAYSFFYGYLEYMLDKKGEPNKNLKEMMEDYESQNNIRFTVYKIFILIPKSLECPPSVEDQSKLMEMRSTLPEKQITVAGVRNRVYKNSVYTIRHPTAINTNVYVCTEYATPLKTFKQVFKNSTAHTEFYNRHKNDILLQFYLTLKQILEHNNMHSMCDLVYYEDKDENGAFHDVGRLLLSKIADIKKSETPKER